MACTKSRLEASDEAAEPRCGRCECSARFQVSLIPELRFDLVSHSVQSVVGAQLLLTVKQAQLISLLAEKYPGACPEEEIRKQLWGDYPINTKAVSNLIAKFQESLRKLGFEVRSEKHDRSYFLVRLS